MSALDTSASDSSPTKLPRRSRNPSTTSIRSIASVRPSVWRTPNSLKIRQDSLSSAADARISCVVAGAEIAPTAGSVREKMVALNVAPPTVPGSPASCATTDLPHEIAAIPEVEAEAPSDTDKPEDKDTDLVPFPVSVSPPTSSRSSWFGSLSRAKGKEKLLEVQTAAPASTPNLLAPPSTIPIPVPDPKPRASESEPVTSSSPDAPERPDPFLSSADVRPTARSTVASSPSRRSWFTSPSHPSPLRVASPINIPPPFPENPSPGPSSIDSSGVPSPVATPPADAAIFPMSEETVKGRQRLTSFNGPPAGRFALNIPLLGGGRAATGSALLTEGATQVFTTTHTTERTETVVQSDSADTSRTITITSTADRATASMSTTTAQQSTWWDYIGWGAAQPQTAPQDTSEDDDEGESTPQPSHRLALDDDADLSPPAPAFAEESDAQTIRPKAVDVSQDQASWYSPWAWYGYTNPPVAPSEETPAEAVDAGTAPAVDPFPAATEPPVVATASTTTTTQDRYWTSFFASSTAQPQSHANVQPSSPEKTPSTSPQPTPSDIKDPPTPSSLSLDSNPIGDSINSNRSGWISFFSNTATLGYVSRKTITSGEPEVMDIDLDEAGEAPATATPPVPPATSQSQEAEKPEGKQPPANGVTPADKPSKPADKPSKPADKPIKSGPSAPPITISETVRRQVANSNTSPAAKRSSSPAPSVASKASTGSKTPAKPSSIAPPRSPVPNLVLPTWKDTFHTLPRSHVPPRVTDGNEKTVGQAVKKTMKFVSDVLFASDGATTTRKGSSGKGKGKVEREQERRFEEWGLSLPRAWDVLKPAAGQSHVSGEADEGNFEDVLRGCRHVVVIGIHGWFPGSVLQSVLGEPTGTSTKFVNMMVSALEEFQSSYHVKLDKITRIPLEGEGTIDRRVEKLYAALTSNDEWMADLHAADVIFVAAHSQGTIVATHLMDRLIQDKHIRTGGSDVSQDPGRRRASSILSTSSVPRPPPQRVCVLALCGIHLGPLRYLSSSSFVQPYLQYFETAAARELFEFQNTESEVSKAYVKALRNVVDNGTKMVYVASLNDQVVPIYSGLFTAASHPLILRSLYIDGDAYHSSDFLSNLMALLIRVMNAGLSDSGLLNHLSEATAGSLNGVGHSTVYEEIANYTLAVKYLFLTNSGFDTQPELVVEPFNANTEQNDYEIPWSLRDLIADERVAYFFSKEISQLATAFRQWSPKTAVLRDIKRKLQPIQRLPSASSSDNPPIASVSKL